MLSLLRSVRMASGSAFGAGGVRGGKAWDGFEALEGRTLLSVVMWDGGGGDMLWHNPLNWAGDVVPGLMDDVRIELSPGETVIYQEGFGAIRSLYSTGGIEFTGGTLVVGSGWDQYGPLTVSGGTVGHHGPWRQFGDFVMTDGVVSGTGDLGLLGSAVWSGGLIAGDGKLQVRRGGELIIDGDVGLGRDLVNNSSVVWQGGDIALTGATIWNLEGRIFHAQSPGEIHDESGEGWFANYGELTRDGGGMTASTISVTMNNRATVSVYEGTLDLAGDVVQKRGGILSGGEWIVSTDDVATLEMSGVGIERMGAMFPLPLGVSRAPEAPPRVVLDGAGAQFPALESLRTVFGGELVLSGGRAFTFMADPSQLPEVSPEFEPHMFYAGRLVLDNPGMMEIPVGIAGQVEVRSGTVVFSERAYVGRFEIAAGAEVVLNGMGARLNEVHGAGLLRIATEAIWESGTMTGGHIIIMPEGTLRIVGQEPIVFFPLPMERPEPTRVLERPLVNYGTIEWDDRWTPLKMGDWLVNHGTFNMHVAWRLESSGPAAHLVNHGTINKMTTSQIIIEQHAGGVRFENTGTVNVLGGRLVLSGGGEWGGSFNVSQGAALVFDGKAGELRNAEIDGAGRLWFQTDVLWIGSQIRGTGDMFVSESGRINFRTFVIGLEPTIERSRIVNMGVMDFGSFSPVTINLNQGVMTNHGTMLFGRFGSTVRVDGHLELAQGSLVHMQRSATMPLDVTVHVIFGGELRAEFDVTPQPGTEIPVIQFGSRTGTFDDVLGIGLPPGSDVAFDFVNGRGVLRVVGA